jgi:uncharacterized membrane protein
MPPIVERKYNDGLVFATLLGVYLVGRGLQLFAGRVPNLVLVLCHVAPPAVFAIIHGSRTYGRRGMLLFCAQCLGVGSFMESLSLRTGFPFGHYHFTGLMGPQVAGLPILLALAYLGMGYASWMVTTTILLKGTRLLAGSQIVTVPICASFLMVAWDFSMDPVWANLDRAWVWEQGGAYFGVPLSNFCGWFLTVFLFYLLFAMAQRNFEAATRPASPRWAILLYALSALGNLLQIVPPGTPASIVDASGRQWMTADILHVSFLVSLLGMLPFAVIGWARTAEVDTAFPPTTAQASQRT